MPKQEMCICLKTGAMIHRQMCKCRYIWICKYENFLAISLSMIYANTQTCFLKQELWLKRSGTRGALMSNVTQRPFRFLIVQQKTVLQIKDFAIGNAIYVKLLFQFTGYSWAGKQSHTELRLWGQQNSGLPQIWLVHVNCSFFEC